MALKVYGSERSAYLSGMGYGNYKGCKLNYIIVHFIGP